MTPEYVGQSLSGSIVEFFKRIRNANQHNQAWHINLRLLLSHTGESDAEFLEAMTLIFRAIDRLEQQFEASPTTSTVAKARARQVLSGLRKSITPSNWGNGVSAALPNFTPEKLDVLEIAGDYLDRDYPTPRFTKDEFAELVNLVDELESLLKSAESLAPEIKALLEPHVRFLKWALSEIGLLGVSGVQRALTISVQDLRTIESNPTPTSEEKGFTEEFGNKVIRFGQIVDGVQKAWGATRAGFKVISDAVSTYQLPPAP